MATQRLGLCRFGFPLCPAPPPAKLRDFVLARLSDSLTMSPLAHHARPHRFPRRYALCAIPLGISDHLTGLADSTRASRQRLWLCRLQSDFAPTSPLRAAGSHGHTAFGYRDSTTHSRVTSFSVRESPFDCKAPCAPSIYCSCLRSRLTVLAPPIYVELHINGGMLRMQKCGVGAAGADFTGGAIC